MSVMRHIVGKKNRRWLVFPWWFDWPFGRCAVCGAWFWRSWPWNCFEEFCSRECCDDEMQQCDQMSTVQTTQTEGHLFKTTTHALGPFDPEGGEVLPCVSCQETKPRDQMVGCEVCGEPLCLDCGVPLDLGTASLFAATCEDCIDLAPELKREIERDSDTWAKRFHASLAAWRQLYREEKARRN